MIISPEPLIAQMCTPHSAASIALTDHKEIAIVIGAPPKKIPAKGNFSGA